MVETMIPSLRLVWDVWDKRAYSYCRRTSSSSKQSTWVNFTRSKYATMIQTSHQIGFWIEWKFLILTYRNPSCSTVNVGWQRRKTMENSRGPFMPRLVWRRMIVCCIDVYLKMWTLNCYALLLCCHVMHCYVIKFLCIWTHVVLVQIIYNPWLHSPATLFKPTNKTDVTHSYCSWMLYCYVILVDDIVHEYHRVNIDYFERFHVSQLSCYSCSTISSNE